MRINTQIYSQIKTKINLKYKNKIMTLSNTPEIRVEDTTPSKIAHTDFYSNNFDLAENDPSRILLEEKLQWTIKETKWEVNSLLASIGECEIAPLDKELSKSLCLAQYNQAIWGLNSLFEEQQKTTV